jgi:hypothetical protein
MDAPVVPGCVIRARLVGTIEANQKAKGEAAELSANSRGN